MLLRIAIFDVPIDFKSRSRDELSGGCPDKGHFLDQCCHSLSAVADWSVEAFPDELSVLQAASPKAKRSTRQMDMHVVFRKRDETMSDTLLNMTSFPSIERSTSGYCWLFNDETCS